MTDALPRVDFKAIKVQADFTAILRYYRIKTIGSGAQRSALCPFHADKRESLSINVEEKVFICFACDARGDILSFVAKMERVSLREAANIIARVCGLLPGDRGSEINGVIPGGTHRGDRREQENVPLTFTLCLDGTHPYLAERGVTPDIIETFGLGYCTRGLLRGRVCIPIHDEKGNLVAYAGRWPSETVPSGEQRYMLPPGFKKSRVLFNLHRVLGKSDHLVVVEGYWSVFRLHAINVPAVALMGRTLSERQECLLRSTGVCRITLFLDGDTPGRQAITKLLPRLAKHFFVRSPALPEGEAPDMVSEEILRKAVQAQ